MNTKAILNEVDNAISPFYPAPKSFFHAVKEDVRMRFNTMKYFIKYVRDVKTANELPQALRMARRAAWLLDNPDAYFRYLLSLLVDPKDQD